MSRYCPLKGTAVYLDCLECDSKECKKTYKYKHIVIGIDQSYKNTGVSLVCDNELKKVTSINLENFNSKYEKRKELRARLGNLLESVTSKGETVTCIIERIRLRSQGFLNIDYIKSIGALNSVIVDVCSDYGVEVFSVDTRCWKASVIGTSKPEANKYNVDEKKWPMIKYLLRLGWDDSILINMDGSRKNKHCFEKNGHKYMFNDDAADSAGIALYYRDGDHSKLQKET